MRSRGLAAGWPRPCAGATAARGRAPHAHDFFQGQLRRLRRVLAQLALHGAVSGEADLEGRARVQRRRALAHGLLQVVHLGEVLAADVQAVRALDGQRLHLAQVASEAHGGAHGAQVEVVLGVVGGGDGGVELEDAEQRELELVDAAQAEGRAHGREVRVPHGQVVPYLARHDHAGEEHRLPVEVADLQPPLGHLEQLLHVDEGHDDALHLHLRREVHVAEELDERVQLRHLDLLHLGAPAEGPHEARPAVALRPHVVPIDEDAELGRHVVHLMCVVTRRGAEHVRAHHAAHHLDGALLVRRGHGLVHVDGGRGVVPPQRWPHEAVNRALHLEGHARRLGDAGLAA
mmetsp:Transcript_1471/g.3919  ORF Transcript_1471/g.3919 Transcript_1471/m.3919 type:complete len:346 (+) Transcript_1471:3159-4196(+)